MPRVVLNGMLAILLIVGIPLFIASRLAPGLFSEPSLATESVLASVNLVDKLRYRIDPDPDQLLSFVNAPDESWRVAKGNVLQLYFADAPVWLKIPLTPEWQALRILEVGTPTLDNVSLYWITNEVRFLGQQGDHAKAKESNFLSPVYKLPPDANAGYLLIRIESRSLINVPVVLWRESAFYENQQNASIMLGGIFGILMVMVLYNIGVWYSVREPSYLFYVGYAINVSGYLACVTGFGFQYLWFFVTPEINDNLYWVFAILSFVFAALFMDHFLALKDVNPMAHKLIKIIAKAYALLFIAFAVFPESKVTGFSFILGGLASVLAWSAGIREWLRGTPGAKFFTLAWTLLFAGTITYILMQTGLLSVNLVTRWIQALGVTSETVLLSFALGERIALLRARARQATETALALASEVNRAHEDKIRYQATVNQQLEEKVLLRTQDLEQARNMAEAANRQKSRFLAAASHDIRQPLHALRLLTESVKHDSPAKYKGSIIGAVEHLVQLFDTLFDLSKLDNDLIRAENRPLNLSTWLHSGAEGFRCLCGNSDIAFQLSLPNEPVWVVTDPLLLQRVLQILIDNAITHSQCSLIELQVRVASGTVTLSVIDDGVGIPVNEQKNVFEEFYQIKRLTTPRRAKIKAKGMGLGLSLANRMGQLLGSPIQLTSSAEWGSCFAMAFAEIAANLEPEMLSLAERDSHLTGKARVLVVDDNEMALHALQQILQGWGFDVRAANGANAMEALLRQGWRPDLAIIDYMLEDDLNGIELARQLRQQTQLHTLPVITVSGDLNILDQTLLEHHHILAKPIKPSMLRAAVQMSLAGQRET